MFVARIGRGDWALCSQKLCLHGHLEHKLCELTRQSSLNLSKTQDLSLEKHWEQQIQVVVSKIVYFHPLPGENDPIWLVFLLTRLKPPTRNAFNGFSNARIFMKINRSGFTSKLAKACSVAVSALEGFCCFSFHADLKRYKYDSNCFHGNLRVPPYALLCYPPQEIRPY